MGKKSTFRIPWSNLAVRGRIERLRSEGNTWAVTASELNKHAVLRRGNHAPWTAESARAFFMNRRPRPATRPKWHHQGHPNTRAECGDKRPCPWASCRHHLAPTVLASAERSFQNADNRRIPIGWGREILDGDFSSLPYTCVLDLIEARGLVSEVAPLYDGLADGEAIGGYLGLSREMVRLDIMRAIRRVADKDPDLGRMLLGWYHASKGHGQTGRKS